jgi:hypothetical protein
MGTSGWNDRREGCAAAGEPFSAARGRWPPLGVADTARTLKPASLSVKLSVNEPRAVAGAGGVSVRCTAAARGGTVDSGTVDSGAVDGGMVGGGAVGGGMVGGGMVGGGMVGGGTGSVAGRACPASDGGGASSSRFSSGRYGDSTGLAVSSTHVVLGAPGMVGGGSPSVIRATTGLIGVLDTTGRCVFGASAETDRDGGSTIASPTGRAGGATAAGRSPSVLVAPAPGTGGLACCVIVAGRSVAGGFVTGPGGVLAAGSRWT